ncbi:MAG: transposase [Cyclobacteriaceae bacterium]
MEPETYYHVYNHANGDENLFRTSENYYFFLKQWAKYIEPVADAHAYCLMPNHFHFLVRTKNEEDLQGVKNPEGLESSKAYQQAFSNLFNSYSKAFNKMFERRGSLFVPNFKKKEITSEAYLTAVITYIHRNPIHHGFVDTLDDWPYSSYHAFLSARKTKLRREEVLNWFGDKNDYIEAHRSEPMSLPDKSLLIDF